LGRAPKSGANHIRNSVSIFLSDNRWSPHPVAEALLLETPAALLTEPTIVPNMKSSFSINDDLASVAARPYTK
jgi:hypothetical protein